MAVQSFNVFPLPETSVRQPDALLAMYNSMLAHDIPGFVIRQSSLPEVASLILSAGLVVPSNANGTPGNNGEHESTSLITEETIDLGYHAHGLPELASPTTIVHHLTTVGKHEHTLGTFAPVFVNAVQGELSAEDRFDMNTDVSHRAERLMRRGEVDTATFSPVVHRGWIEEGDIVVNRLTGASPNIHDFRTITGPDEGSDRRSATLRGYTALVK